MSNCNILNFLLKIVSILYLVLVEKVINIFFMDKNQKIEIQSATFERLLKHLDERKDVQNIDLMNLANFCRNCLSRWFREEAEKKGVSISDPEARERIYGMPYTEWKDKYQK